MKLLGHLRVEEIKLPPGQEWQDASATWRFLRIQEGAAYWLGGSQNRLLAEGEVMVVPPPVKGSVRASQIGEVTLHGFGFAPGLMYGFFTLSERQSLENAAGKAAEVRFIPSTHPVAQQFAGLNRIGPDAASLARRVMALNLVAAFFEDELNRSRPPQSLGTSALHRFRQLIIRMPDNEMINHPPEELARLCGCSGRHFNRLFREQFGVSARDRQTELRLLKARQLLGESDDKIINIAMESGYRNLSLFNGLFKRHFGMTPSQWRHKARRTVAKGAGVAVAIWFFHGLPAASAQGVTNAPPAAAAPATNAVPTFEVRGYRLDGNTLLPAAAYEPILQDHVGPAVTFTTIRDCIANLTIAYRVRGYSTVALSLPQQQLTNGIVTVKVTEGRLVAVKVTGNQYFSTRNVLRTLPSLHTNEVLNSILLQAELDRANANGYRQIYPVVAPGPEPCTSVLELRVKDKPPYRARFEMNNDNTPNSPALRMNLSGSYDNLWQLEHQIGVQYSLTPEVLKSGMVDYLVDAPLIASYSAFYRLPLGPVNGTPDENTEETGDGKFGYDEATRKFNLPPATGRPEINVYASRSTSDSGRNITQVTLTPTTVPDTGGLQVSDQRHSRSVSATENLGLRVTKPLPQFWQIQSSISAGLDYKAYRALAVQDRIFAATVFVPSQGSTGPPFDSFPSPPTASSQHTDSGWLQYVPVALNYDASRPDEHGLTSFNLYQSYEASDNLGHYYVVSSGFTREQKLENDWGVRLHADGQWANQQLFNNEQFGLGGEAGVRGYPEGETYGDNGWRATVEPHTPQFDLGLVDDTEPMQARLYAFFDYGERYNRSSTVFRSSPPTEGTEPKAVALAGTGAGISATIGDNVDMRLQIAFALLDFPQAVEPVSSGEMRISFSVGATF